MRARREDQWVSSCSGTPVTSRMVRRPDASAAGASDRGVKLSPRRRCSSASTRVLYRSDADTAALNRTRPSRLNHRPGVPSAVRTRTLEETATWVCRSGSPARESRCSNAAASIPVVSSCCTPLRPPRVRTASRSSQDNASCTAAWCAAAIWSATSLGAIAHNADTDFTGVKLKSNPATAVVAAREWRAMNEDSSRGSFGGRAYCWANMSRPTSVRTRARSAAGNGQSCGIPSPALTCAQALATATRNAGAESITANGAPSRIASCTSCRRPDPPARLSMTCSVMASAFGCLPSPNKAPICAAVTSCPSCRSTSPRAEPSHCPGDSPRWL